MRDMLGNILTKGDMVAYGVKGGYNGELRLGIVLGDEENSIYAVTPVYNDVSDDVIYDFSKRKSRNVSEDKILKIDKTAYDKVYYKLKERAKKWL